MQMTKVMRAGNLIFLRYFLSQERVGSMYLVFTPRKCTHTFLNVANPRTAKVRQEQQLHWSLKKSQAINPHKPTTAGFNAKQPINCSRSCKEFGSNMLETSPGLVICFNYLWP